MSQNIILDPDKKAYRQIEMHMPPTETLHIVTKQYVDALVTNKVPITRTVNGKALSSDISLTKADIGLSVVPDIDATNAANITTGVMSTTRLPTTVTIAGNVFNSANNLLKLDATGKIPAVDGSAITGLNGSNIATGTVSDARLSSTVTKAGNTFNTANNLLKLDAAGKMPAVDGSAITNISAANINLSTVSFNKPGDLIMLDNSGRIPALDGSLVTNINGAALTSGAIPDARHSVNVTMGGNTFNTINSLVKLDSAGKLPAVDGSLVTGINASNIGSGSLPDVRLSGNVTMAGNTFNTASNLVKLDVNGKLPAVDGSLVTNIPITSTTGNIPDNRLNSTVTVAGNSFNVANGLLKLDANGKIPSIDGSLITNIPITSTTGNVPDTRLNTTVTLAGNSFNTAGNIVKLDVNGKLPAVDGSLVTNLNGVSITSGTIPDARHSTNVTLGGNTFNTAGNIVKLDVNGKLPAVDGSLITNIPITSTTGSVPDNRLNTTVTLAGNTFNTAGNLLKLDANGKLPVVDGSLVTNINGSSISSGTIPDARHSTNVTLGGNTFNTAGNIVKLDATGKLPGVDGSLLTNLNIASATGTIADARLSANVTLGGNTFNTANNLLKLDANGKLPAMSGDNLTCVVHTNGDDLAIAGNKTFSGNIQFASYFDTNSISPIADSTTALRITKANNATNVVVFDTVNSKVSFGLNATAPISNMDVFGSSTVDGQYTMQSKIVRNTNATIGTGTTTHNVAGSYVEAGNGDISMATVARYDTGDTIGTVGTVTAHTTGIMSNGVTRIKVDVNGNVVAGAGTLATTATNGFMYIPSTAGVPTGAATAYSGFCPMVVDTTNLRLYIRVGTTWRRASLA